MEAISGRKAIHEIAAEHAVHLIQVNQRKRQLLDGASELFTRFKKTFLPGSRIPAARRGLTRG